MKKIFNTPIILITVLAFLLNAFGPLPAVWAVSPAYIALPAPGTMLQPSRPFTPVMVKGLMVDPQNPFKFDLLVDSGDTGLKTNQLQNESLKLIKYFLAALAVPDEEMWVNLSPYEKNRIISRSLGATEMGRDLLAQDYILKQLTASLTYPESRIGKEFWNKIYTEVKSKLGTSDIPINTFNKVWIIPENAEIYEHGNKAFIVSSRLKVMLEEDYLSLQKHALASPLNSRNSTHSIGADIVRQTIIPILEHEVNEGQYFANLRQIYQAMILATWYKIRLKESVLGKSYVNQGKTKGIALIDQTVNLRIYQQYLRAFKKGVYNYIKEESDPQTQEIIPRKYFSGGYDGAQLTKIVSRGFGADPARIHVTGRLSDVRFRVTTASPYDRAMTVPVSVSQEGLRDEYYSDISGIMVPAVERFNHDEPIVGEEFVRSLFIETLKRNFVPRDVPQSVFAQEKVKKGEKDRELILSAKSIRATLEESGFFPKVRYFGFIIAAWIGEQAFGNFTNVYFPRDMGPGYTIQETLDSLDPVFRKDHPSEIYYLSRDTLGQKYYQEVLQIINGEKLSGIAVLEIIKELEKEDMRADLDLLDLIRSNEFQEQYRRLAQSKITNGTEDIVLLLQSITSEKPVRTVIRKSGIKINPEQTGRLVELIKRLSPRIPAIEARISTVMEEKRPVPFMKRVIKRIQDKIESDQDFEDKVKHIRSDIEKMGLNEKPRVRFVDSGAGTFLIFLQTIFAIYYPKVETKSLALGAFNDDVIDVYDIQKWNEGIQKMVAEDKILDNYAKFTLHSMENAERFIFHPIVYDNSVKGIVRTPVDAHLKADWTLVNFSLAAIDYMQALRKIQKETGQSLEDAARDIKERLGIREFTDPETGQTNILENPSDNPPSPPIHPPTSISSSTGLLIGGAAAIAISLYPIATDNNKVEPPTMEASSTLVPLQPPSPAQAPDIRLTLNPPPSLLPPFVLPEFPDPAHQQSTFITRSGDTLSGLAYSFYGNGGLEGYMKIFAANSVEFPFLESPHKIGTGVPLNIPDAKIELYTFKRGDSLENLARAYYGDVTQWYRIAYLNRITDPTKIKEGTVMIPMSIEEWNRWLNRPSPGKEHPDKAMNIENPGGIDLNSKNLKIQIKNDGVDMHFSHMPASRQQINALYPVIVDIIPVTDLPVLLGLDRKPVVESRPIFE